MLSMKKLLWTVPLVACTPSQPASYPDQDNVAAAQEKWCAMLAEIDGEKLAGWRYEKECLAAKPSGSSVYVERLAECYGRTVADYGGDAPDSASIIETCTAEIMAAANPGDVTTTDLYQARCDRMQRCSQVTPEQCANAWERVDPAAQALLTSMYNLRAQAEIASCLRDTDCTEDEDGAERACYAPHRDARAWLPLSLASDPTIGPAVD